MTIKDIARETGYSIGTVSRVLNNHPNVSEKARKVIEEAVDRNGFILNASAKNLKQTQADNIVVIVKGTSNTMFCDMVTDIQRFFHNTNYTVITEYADEDENEVMHARLVCLDKKAKGLFILGGNRNNFKSDFDKLHIPTVLLTNYASDWGMENLSSVGTDDVLAAKEAVSYLLKRGHRKIAVIGGSEISDTGRQRRLGFAKAHEELKIPKEEWGPIVDGRFSFQAGYKAMQEVLQKLPETSAVFAIADVCAIGAISAIHDAGKRVPEDISVVGFDGIPISEFYCPKLTTILQETERIAIKGCEILVDCLEKGSKQQHAFVPYKLLERQSVRKKEK